MTTWAEGPDGPDRDGGFGVDALPYGVFRVAGASPRVGVRIADRVLDVAVVAEALAPELVALFDRPVLNPFMAAGAGTWRDARARITDWLTDPRHRATVEPHLHALSGVRLQMPFQVGDYVDFYSSRQHTENLAGFFRPGQPALPASWLHLPIGYHGRAGTVVPSGTEILRPRGQRRLDPDATPTFGPSVRLDIEAEVGFVVGTPSQLGEPVDIADAAEHIFGVVLVNDWSARDIQSFEYVPLGPFLGKSFATTVSHWVLPLAALHHARVTSPPREVPVADYLREDEPWGLDLQLQVELNGTVVSRPPFGETYWTPTQQLTHLTVNGASVRTGDLFASGTVSGPAPDQHGSLIEISSNGQRPIVLPDGSSRSFLADGDEVTITATAPGPADGRVALGEVSGRILPAR